MDKTLQNKFKACYAVFIVCVLTSAIPENITQTVSLIISVVALIAYYVVRRSFEKGSLPHNEMSFLIRSFWIWSVIYLIGIIAAGLLISKFGDTSAINEWAQSVVDGGAADEESMKAATAEYMAANLGLIIKMTLLCLSPSVVYALWRSKQGLTRILKGDAAGQAA